MDLNERHRVDVSVASVRAKARRWRYIFALVVAIAGAIAAEVSGVKGWGAAFAPPSTIAGHSVGPSEAERLAYICGATAFLVLGMAAAVGLSRMVRITSQPLIGQAHAGVLRYVLVLVGLFAVLTFSLAIAHIDVKQLLVSGAVAGVLLGIAAQQSLANLFAGLVLLFARPFRVGDHVRFRAGALSGQIEGIVVDVSLTYVRMQTEEGQVLLPNSQALAAAVLLVPDDLPGGPAEPPALSVPGTVSSAAGRSAAGPSVPGNTLR